MPEIQVQELLADQDHRLGLKLLAGGEGLKNPIRVPRIQKPGLALAGYTSQVRQYRVQVLGATELEYLATRPEADQVQAVRALFELGLPCFAVTKGLTPPPIFLEQAERTSTPLLGTSVTSSIFIERITRFLEARLAPVTRVHGVLIDVMELGVLLIGGSGIGKSECAMDLILKGHRLVADDVVHIRLMPPFRLVGRGEDLIRYHMEIRGVGIVNVRELFGITAVREEQDIELVIELVPWREGEEYERLGLDERRHRILGVEVPHLRIPVGPGRNIASVVEVAVRNQLLRKMGFNSAIQLKEKLDRVLQQGGE